MTDKELAEIRRRYKSDKTSISRVRGCYVNDKNEIVAEFDQSLGLMSEDEIEFILGLLKKSISGANGKNIFDVAFTNQQVVDGAEHNRLMKLRDTAIASDEDVHALYESIISSTHFDAGYLILLAYDKYDVYSYAGDGSRREDSDTVFSYIICSVCPMKLTRAALGYNANENAFRAIASNAVIAAPELGFMFPTFDNRCANIYNAVCYTKNIKESREAFTSSVFGCAAPMPPAEQKATFDSVLREAVGEECSYEVVSGVRDLVCDIIEEQKENKVEEPLMITRSVMHDLLGKCNVPEEKIETFEQRYVEEFGEHARLCPGNVISTKRLEVKTPEVVVKVSPDRSDLVETRTIDGVKYILIRAETGVEVNGVDVDIK